VGWTEIAIICVAAFATSAISAVVGFGGGLVLLVVLLGFMDPLIAVGVHAAIQLSSNSSRALVHRSWINWRIVGFHTLLLVPATFVGLALAERLPVSGGRLIIAVFVLIATWRPTWLGRQLSRAPDERVFIATGGIQGALNIPLGATGPLVAPYFRAALPQRRAMIGTFATAQTLGHLVKLAVIGLGGIALGENLTLIVLASVAVVLGTRFGSTLLNRLSEASFDQIFRIGLTAMALQLIVRTFA